ncbi:MAG TPA: polymer-forming cytoskeletal protein, partial [Micavibrio sp.]
GTIEAALKGAKTLDIAETGVFYGTVEIEEATIAGRFEGDLTVNGRLTIRASGSITGAISYKELAVEAGATLDGKVTPLSGSKLEKKPEGRPGQSKKMPMRNDNSGNELPFSEKASA